MALLPSLARFARLVVSLLGLASGAQAQSAAAFDHSHARWSAVLAACVREGGIAYGKLKADHAELDAYLAALHAATPAELAGWSDAQRCAFWINAYNAHCVRRVLDAYPLKSIRRLDGAGGMNTVFAKPFIPMRAHHPGGKDAELALNDIQDGILRKRFKDARVHAALHNGSKSSPKLRAEAYTADELDAQLGEQMRTFINDPARNRIDLGTKELALSEVFKWFAEDFEREARSVPEFLVRYAPAEKAEFLRAAKIRWLPYDWELDDVP
ncbi:MAG: DUF547 domain-containing protein [Planctomycetes bacterium]|nr:DUF547 domain-containing protein [Planctomycetota bacterium]